MRNGLSCNYGCALWRRMAGVQPQRGLLAASSRATLDGTRRKRTAALKIYKQHQHTITACDVACLLVALRGALGRALDVTRQASKKARSLSIHAMNIN
jgi:hypothetical protein